MNNIDQVDALVQRWAEFFRQVEEAAYMMRTKLAAMGTVRAAFDDSDQAEHYARSKHETAQKMVDAGANYFQQLIDDLQADLGGEHG